MNVLSLSKIVRYDFISQNNSGTDIFKLFIKNKTYIFWDYVKIPFKSQLLIIYNIKAYENIAIKKSFDIDTKLGRTEYYQSVSDKVN